MSRFPNYSTVDRVWERFRFLSQYQERQEVFEYREFPEHELSALYFKRLRRLNWLLDRNSSVLNPRGEMMLRRAVFSTYYVLRQLGFLDEINRVLQINPEERYMPSN